MRSYALKLWKPGAAAMQTVLAKSGEDLVEPVVVAAHERPKRHPSALHDWDYANLLALDARVSRDGALKGVPATVRLETQDADGHAVAMGTAPVEAGWIVFCEGAGGSGDSVCAAGCEGRCSAAGARMVLDSARRAADLRGMPCGAGACGGESRAGSSAAHHDARGSDRRGADIAAGRQLSVIPHFSSFVEHGLHCGGADAQRASCRLGGSWPRSGTGAKSTIRFEDASAKAGINFTHSFGSAKLGSLLEGTGAGCVWIDYNNSAGLRSTW